MTQRAPDVDDSTASSRRDVLDSAPSAARRSARRMRQHARDRRRALVLFVLTLCTTSYAGLMLSASYQQYRIAQSLMGFSLTSEAQALLHLPTVARQALSFPLALLTILGCHEMGHYLQARRLHVAVSPPFFLPSLPPLGTFGAVIRMDVGSGVRANALMHVAATGPIAGMVPAVIALALGISWSEWTVLPFDTHDTVFMHGGLLVQGMERWILGPVPAGYDVVWHPVAFAGWAGCFVTALNMLPIGQLDGGHVIYGLWPRHAARIARATIGLLLLAGFFYVGWWIIAALLIGLIGVKHPPIVTDGVATGRVRWLGFVAMALFLLTFHPAPISHSGALDIARAVQEAWALRPMSW